MASSVVVMATLENGLVERVVSRDIHVTLIGQDACLNLPVGEAGSERKRDIFVHGLEDLENEGVTGRGGFDAV